MSKRLFALNLLRAAAAVLFSVKLAQVLSSPRSLPPPSAPAVPQASVATKSEPAPPRPPLAAYGAVATRNLFNPNRTEAVAGPAPLPPAARPVLHGVVINAETRLAYIEDPTTKQVFGYKTGDTVAGGQLERIEDDRVVIKRPEGLLEVKLKDPNKPKPLVSPPLRPGVPPAVQPPRSVAPIAPGIRPGIPRPPRPPVSPQEEAGTPGAPPPSQ